MRNLKGYSYSLFIFVLSTLIVKRFTFSSRHILVNNNNIFTQ